MRLRIEDLRFWYLELGVQNGGFKVWGVAARASVSRPHVCRATTLV